MTRERAAELIQALIDQRNDPSNASALAVFGTCRTRGALNEALRLGLDALLALPVRLENQQVQEKKELDTRPDNPSGVRCADHRGDQRGSSRQEPYMPIDAELLPCPFCGGPASLTNVRMSNHTFIVGCYNELCVRPRTDGYGAKEDVIRLWNARPLPDIAGIEPRPSGTFLDWIDLEAMRQLMRPRYSLTNLPLEQESWWQDWKKLRTRIESQIGSGNQATPSHSDATSRSAAQKENSHSDPALTSVEQAKEALERFVDDSGVAQFRKELDALILAVRAEHQQEIEELKENIEILAHPSFKAAIDDIQAGRIIPMACVDHEATIERLKAELADAEQQLTVLRPGGTFAWKTRAEAAEALLARLPVLTANEQHLLDLYRQNLCGDQDCEGARFSAAQDVLKGALTHREIADAVKDYMLERSLSLPVREQQEEAEPLNLRLHRYDNGRFVIYGRKGEFGFSGHGSTPQEALMHWVMARNTDTRPMWPVDRHDRCPKIDHPNGTSGGTLAGDGSNGTPT